VATEDDQIRSRRPGDLERVLCSRLLADTTQAIDEVVGQAGS